MGVGSGHSIRRIEMRYDCVLKQIHALKTSGEGLKASFNLDLGQQKAKD